MSRLRTLGLTVVIVLSLVAGGFAGGVAADPYDGDRADLEIEQPPYVDEDVSVEEAENATVYHVTGPEHTISFENYPAENVSSVGILDGPGEIERTDGGDAFAFETDSEATTAVYFDVDTGDGTQRYVADIRASNVEWTHVPAAEYEAMEEELATFESLKQQASSAVPGQDPVETLESGIGFEAFFDSPTATLRENMQGTLIMLFMTPGGLLIAGTFIGVTVLMLARAYRYKNRTQKQLQELEEMDREKDEAWLQKSRKIIQQMDHNELWPDHISRAMRDHFGENTWLAFKQYTLLRSPASVKGTLLQMMAQTGHVGRVEVDDAGNVVSARVVDAPEDDGEASSIPVADGGDSEYTVREIDLSDLEYDAEFDREVIAAIPDDDLDRDVFQKDVDPTEVSFPIDNSEVSDAELIDELDPEFPGDFEDREELARVLAELMEFVANHDHTDDDGNVRREMDLLSFLMEMDTILHDEADFPTAYDYQKELLYVAEHMDKGDRLNERIDALSLDGVSRGGAQIDFDGGGASV